RMKHYSEAAVERMMKVREVILRALAKRITWWQAAEILGISDRSMRRWRERYQKHGYDGLFDRRLGKPSPKRVPVEAVEKVLGLYQEKYFDLNVRHFHEKLKEEHGVALSYTWVKLALQGAGVVKKGRKRGTHRRGRPEGRPRPAHAGGTGDEGAGDSDDPGLLAAGAGAQRAQLRDMARAATAGVASGGDADSGGGQPFPARALHGGIQPALCGAGR